VNQSKSIKYLHGFSETEQQRLRHQAEFAEQLVYRDVDLSGVEKLLEVGCGVGAQSEILMRRFPKIHLTGIDLNEAQLLSAESSLRAKSYLEGRYEIHKMDATNMEFPSNHFDGAFMSFVLEHVPQPTRVMSEVRRVLRPGSIVYVTEAMNHSFFLDPYSPNMWRYWMAFNDYQIEHGGDPFVGAKLGNILTQVGFKSVRTRIRPWHFDNRHPERRKEIIEFWTDLLLSAKDNLLAANYVPIDVVEMAVKELKEVRNDPNAVFTFSLMQARAVVM